MEIDLERLKQLEDDIVTKVQGRVEDRLFRKYLTMGGFVAAVTAFFGWSVIDSIEEKAEDLARGAAAPAISEAEDAVKQATASANSAQNAADNAALRIDNVDEYLERREEILLSVLSDTSSQRRSVEQMRTEAQEFFTFTEAKSQELDEIRQKLADRFEELNNDLSDYQTRTEEFSIELNKLASAGDLETVANTVDVLGTQLSAMNRQLDELSQKASTTENLVQQGADGAVIDGAVADVKPEKSNALIETTVYFQFAGVTRELAEAISSRLQTSDYVVPEEERTSIAAGMHEIRFFFSEDRERATKLQEDINTVLLTMGLKSDVTIRDLTTYQGAKPRRGTLELWLEPIPS
ncbi:MAG: hypothetical protein ABJH07_00160 [Sedimentitalea sp.]|uniref:hypothetical protein n=1 Tax=Sedimentitalea sp. TaxID=2048915 RepID=UPI00326332F8